MKKEKRRFYSRMDKILKKYGDNPYAEIKVAHKYKIKKRKRMIGDITMPGFKIDQINDRIPV